MELLTLMKIDAVDLCNAGCHWLRDRGVASDKILGRPDRLK